MDKRSFIDYESGTDPKPCCIDCGKPYADFALDLLLPRWQWLLIHPQDGGVLCANCIVDRAAKIPGAVAVHATIGITPGAGPWEPLTAPEPEGVM